MDSDRFDRVVKALGHGASMQIGLQHVRQGLTTVQEEIMETTYETFSDAARLIRITNTANPMPDYLRETIEQTRATVLQHSKSRRGLSLPGPTQAVQPVGCNASLSTWPSSPRMKVSSRLWRQKPASAALG